MRVKLLHIGSSWGIRIPNKLIKLFGLGDVVDVNVTPEGLVIARRREPRDGWKQSFAATPAPATETLLDQFPQNAFDDEEWTW